MTCVLLLTIFAIGCGYNSQAGMAASTAPTITQLMPNGTPSGGLPFTLNVMGSNFVNGAVVYWNNGTRTTTFVSATHVAAAIPAADIAAAATVSVYVKNPGGTGIYMNQGGQSSNSLDFTVTP